MEIEVKFFGTFRDAVGERTIRQELEEGTTVVGLLCTLEQRYSDLEGELLGDDDELPPSLVVLRNGVNISGRGDLDTELDGGDRLALSLPVSGGVVTRTDR